MGKRIAKTFTFQRPDEKNEQLETVTVDVVLEKIRGGYEFSADGKSLKVKSIELDELDAEAVVNQLGLKKNEDAVAFVHKLALYFRLSPKSKLNVPEIEISSIDNRKGISIDLGDTFLFVEKEKSWALQVYDTVEQRSLTPYFHVGTLKELEKHAVFKEALKLKFAARLVPLITAKIIETIESLPEEEWQIETEKEAAEARTPRIPVDLPTSEDVSDVFAYQGDRRFNSRIQIKSTGFPQSRFMKLEFSCNRSREDLCSICNFEGYTLSLSENFDASAFAIYFDSDNPKDALKVLQQNGKVSCCSKVSVLGEQENAVTQAIVSDRHGNEAKAWFVYNPEKCDLRTSPNWIFCKGYLCRGKKGRIGVFVTEFKAESEVIKPAPETVKAAQEYLRSITTEDEPTIWKIARALHKKSNLKGTETTRGFAADLLFVGSPVWVKTPEGPSMLAMTCVEIGETTSAKSQRLRLFIEWIEAGKYESGRKTTAGLAAGAEKIEGIGWVMRKGLLPSADLSFLVLDNMSPHSLDEHIESRRNGIIELSTIKSSELWARTRLKLLSNPEVPFDQHLYKCSALKVYDSKFIARFTFVTFVYGEKPDVRYDPVIFSLSEDDKRLLNAAWVVLRWNLAQEITYKVPSKLWSIIMEYSKQLELDFGNEEVPVFLRSNPVKVATLAACFALFEGCEPTETNEKHVLNAYEWLVHCGKAAEFDSFTKEWKKEHRLSQDEYLELKQTIEAQIASYMAEQGGELSDSDLFKFLEHVARRGQAPMEEIAAALSVSDKTVKRRAKEMKGWGLLQSSIKGYFFTPKGVRFYKRWLKELRDGDPDDPKDPAFNGHTSVFPEKNALTQKTEVNKVIGVTINGNVMSAVKDWCRANRNERSEASLEALTAFIVKELKIVSNPQRVVEKAFKDGILAPSTKPGLAVVV